VGELLEQRLSRSPVISPCPSGEMSGLYPWTWVAFPLLEGGQGLDIICVLFPPTWCQEAGGKSLFPTQSWGIASVSYWLHHMGLGTISSLSLITLLVCFPSLSWFALLKSMLTSTCKGTKYRGSGCNPC
jgi:hypothetical protein